MRTLIKLFNVVVFYWSDIVKIFNWLKENEATLTEMADYLNPDE